SPTHHFAVFNAWPGARPDQTVFTLEVAKAKTQGRKNPPLPKKNVPRNIHGIYLGSRPDDARRWLDEPVVAEVVIVGDVCDQTNAACVETLTGHSVVGVGDFVLEKIRADLRVDEKASVARSDVSPDEWDLKVVAKTRGRIEASRSGIFRVQSHIAERRTGVQIPSIHIQPGNVGADLNAGEILRRARIANQVAGNRATKVYVSGCCGRAVSEVAADAAGPYAATRLVRLRIGRRPDERTGLRQERGVRGVDGGDKRADRRSYARNSGRGCLSRETRPWIQADRSALSVRGR